MFGTFPESRAALAVAALFFVSCGGALDVYNADDEDAGQPPTGMPDAGQPLDQGTSTPIDQGGSTPTDMGSEPDLPTIDMEMPPPDPTTNVPQQGPTVEEQILSQCSTIAVKGLSLQLIDQMNCEEPGIMKSFEGAPGISYGPVVFPFQQGPATDTLTSVAANNPGTMPVNSALRTLPQQFLLYEWYNRGLCNANLAASPGRSNHNGGLAVDIGNNDAWRSAMRAADYVDNVSGEPWHFYYSGPGGRDVRSLSVLAFQKLYNYNFPENPIDEDGVYGPQTEGALESAPANGFTAEPRCEASMTMVAYPHRAPLDVDFEYVGDGFFSVRTLAPSGVRLVEYFVNGRLAGFADADHQVFETVVKLRLDELENAEIEIVAYDRTGAERGSATGLVSVLEERAFFVRPMGGTNYEIGIEELPNDVRDVDIFIDGTLLEQDPDLRISRGTPYRITTQLDGPATVDVALFDRRDRVRTMRELSFE